MVVTRGNTDDLTRKLGLSCAGVERWCSTWRMVVNGGKTEIILFNCEASDIKALVLNGDPCQITKSLGMVVDNQLTYRQHAESTAEKASRNGTPYLAIVTTNGASPFLHSFCCTRQHFFPYFYMPLQSGLKEVAAASKEYKVISAERFSIVAIRQTLKVVKCYWEYHLLIY